MQQTAGGCDREGHVLAAEARQIACAKLLAELAGRGVGIKVPGRAPFQARYAFECSRCLPGLTDQQLARFEAFQFTQQIAERVQYLHAKPPAGQIQHRQSIGVTMFGAGRQQIVAPLLQQGLIGNRAGRDDTNHLAFHRPLGPGRIADLLAYGDRFTQSHQPTQVLIHGVHRYTGHGNGFTRRLPAAREGDIQQARGATCVVVEQLVKVSHAIEDQNVRVLGLDAQVLLHHGRVRRCLLRHG